MICEFFNIKKTKKRSLQFLLLYVTFDNSLHSSCNSSCECVLRLTAAGLVQSVERLTVEREIAGSTPGAGPIHRVLK